MSILGDDSDPIIVHSVGGDIPAGEVRQTVLGAATDKQAAENFREGLAEVEDAGRKANTEFYGATAYTPGRNEGATVTPLTTVIDADFVFDGDEDDEPSDIRIVLHPEQGRKLAELLKLHIDLDVVALDNDEPESAKFVTALIEAIEQAS